jgi:plasmid stabilization system protein ParE
MFYEHLRFLKHESHGAAHRLVSSYRKSVARIADNPFQFPIADDLDLPGIAPNTYRKCLFESRYKVMFRLEENKAIIIAVIDSRMENKDTLGKD